MAASRPCEQCGTVKRCAMSLGPDGRPIYLCRVCERELEAEPTAGPTTDFSRRDQIAYDHACGYGD